MKLFVITNPDFFQGESEAIVQLFDEGLETLHLRKPGATEQEMEQLLQSLPPQYLNRIVIHDHFDLALRYPLKGVHLNKRNPKPPLCYHGNVSYSCHTLEEVDIWSYRCTYVFLSPIFDSISKEGYHASFSIDELRRARNVGIIGRNVIALGGITPQHLPQVKSLGFGGVAVLGYLWNTDERTRIKRFRELRCALQNPPTVLSIAGSDCSGGAGIQADIKTISAHGGYAAAAVTAVTVQNTLGVQAVHIVPPGIVRAQVQAVMSDLPVGAVKIGMVPDCATAHAIVEALSDYPDIPIVYDPVMISTSGRQLMRPDTLAFIESELFPRCTLITPNIPEATALTGMAIYNSQDMEKAALALYYKFGTQILIKGGHLQTDNMCDAFCYRGQITLLSTQQVSSTNLHGTGCTLSSAIAYKLAAGTPMAMAIIDSKSYLTKAIFYGRDLHIGGGNGPLCHFFTQNNKDI